MGDRGSKGAATSKSGWRTGPTALLMGVVVFVALALGCNSSDHESSNRLDAHGPEVGSTDTNSKDADDNDTNNQDAGDNDTDNKDADNKDADNKDADDKDADDKDADDKGTDSQDAEGAETGRPDAGRPEPSPDGFTTYEAESGTTNGSISTAPLPPSTQFSTPELEASGRSFVVLDQTGEYVEIEATRNANAIVVRHSIPDAPSGGGITATLSLYVDGVHRQDLSLRSRYNWLYGGGDNGNSDNPSDGNPHRFWDEDRAFVLSGILRGQTVRLQKDASDAPALYRIDLIDLEEVADPLTPPADALSVVVDCGAVSRGGNNYDIDHAALNGCIGRSANEDRVLWFPPGVFRATQQINVNGATIAGAGFWHSSIVLDVAPGNWRAILRFGGQGSVVRDLFLETPQLTRRSNNLHGIDGGGSDWRIERVWIEHVDAGMWKGGSNGLITGCRIRNTYADGININGAASDIVIEHNSFRNTGDDSIAEFSEPAHGGQSRRVKIRFNTVVQPWWAHAIGIYGGIDIEVTDNFVQDPAKFSGITIGTYSNGADINSYGLDGAFVARNIFVRAGGNAYNQNQSAVKVYSPMAVSQDIVISNNEIRDSVYAGFEAQTGEAHIRVESNVIDAPRRQGFLIRGGASGTGVFSSNTVTNLGAGQVAFSNQGGVDYTATLSANNF